jgi:integrase
MKDWILPPTRFLSKDDLGKLLKRAEELRMLGVSRKRKQPVKDWMIVRLAIFSGLRASEISDLKIVDAHIGHGNSAIVVQRGKNGKSRLVHIGADLKRDLRWYLRWRAEQNDLRPDSHLIPGQRRDRMSRVAIWKRWKKLCPNHRLHDARHTHGTLLYEATTDLRLVQKNLGHAHPSTTSVYADVCDSKAKEGMAAMDKLAREALRQDNDLKLDDNLPGTPGRVRVPMAS